MGGKKKGTNPVSYFLTYKAVLDPSPDGDFFYVGMPVLPTGNIVALYVARYRGSQSADSASDDIYALVMDVDGESTSNLRSLKLDEVVESRNGVPLPRTHSVLTCKSKSKESKEILDFLREQHPCVPGGSQDIHPIPRPRHHYQEDYRYHHQDVIGQYGHHRQSVDDRHGPYTYYGHNHQDSGHDHDQHGRHPQDDVPDTDRSLARSALQALGTLQKYFERQIR